MGLAPRSPVTAPFAAPPRVGLLASIRELADAGRWDGGFAFAPEQCGESGVGNPCSNDTKQIADNPAVIDTEPFFVWAGDRCSAFDRTRDFAARARRQLEATQSYQLAHELWTGTLARSEVDASGNPWPNKYLTSEASDVLSASPMTPINALACLEQAVGGCAKGARGVIHATRQATILWDQAGMLRREGNLILTVLDTIVIPDAGYDGSGPYGAATDGSQWAYATGLPLIRLAPIRVVPDDISQALARSDNTVEYRAERLAAVTWDGCCHLAVEMNIPLCAIGGLGS